MIRTVLAVSLLPLAIAACASSEAPEAGAPAPAASAAPAAAAAAAPAARQVTLASVIANPARDDGHEARDQFRHPKETLEFFGVKPGMTVIEIAPGSGYYAEILSPYLAAGGGKYIGTGNPIAKVADAAWGPQTYVPFGKDSGPLAPAGSADMVLTFRNIHNWYWQDGMLDKAMADFAAALKPGGVLGVVEHRADPLPEAVANGRKASNGYVAKATIIAAAQKAGLVLDGESEVNANPKDTKDHPFGVWTLPPNSWTSQGNRGETPAGFDAAKYKAIGESDRQTLRFKKPA